MNATRAKKDCSLSLLRWLFLLHFARWLFLLFTFLAVQFLAAAGCSLLFLTFLAALAVLAVHFPLRWLFSLCTFLVALAVLVLQIPRYWLFFLFTFSAVLVFTFVALARTLSSLRWLFLLFTTQFALAVLAAIQFPRCAGSCCSRFFCSLSSLCCLSFPLSHA